MQRFSRFTSLLLSLKVPPIILLLREVLRKTRKHNLHLPQPERAGVGRSASSILKSLTDVWFLLVDRDLKWLFQRNVCQKWINETKQSAAESGRFSPCCHCACATRKRHLFPPVVIYGSQFLNRESLKVIWHGWQSLRTKAKSFSFSCYVFISSIFLFASWKYVKRPVSADPTSSRSLWFQG